MLKEKLIENIKIKEDNSFSVIKKNYWKKYISSSSFSLVIYFFILIAFIVISRIKKDSQYIYAGLVLFAIGILWIIIEGFIRFSRMKKQYLEIKSVVVNLCIYEKHIEIYEEKEKRNSSINSYTYSSFDSISFDEKKKRFVFKKKRGVLLIDESDVSLETKDFLLGIRK